MSQLSQSVLLAIIAKMTLDNSSAGNPLIADDINRLQTYVNTGIDPAGSVMDATQIATMMQPIADDVNNIHSGLDTFDPAIVTTQTQQLVDDVAALQQYVQSFQKSPPPPVTLLQRNTATRGPLHSQQQPFPLK